MLRAARANDLKLVLLWFGAWKNSMSTYVPGQGITVMFAPVGAGPPLAGIDSVWEGTYDARGVWVPGRLLNGDQTHQGRHLRLAPGMFQIQRVRFYRYR